jgi:ABC-type nitrate/sulfonate/bicarbonate transport system ATPase subunit
LLLSASVVGVYPAWLPTADPAFVPGASRLDRLGFADFARAYPKERSDGMEQRVGLARALAVDPAELLMDEPFGSVDARTRPRLQRELLDVRRETAGTILVVTHDIKDAILPGDRVMVMRDTPGRTSESRRSTWRAPATGRAQR